MGCGNGCPGKANSIKDPGNAYRVSISGILFMPCLYGLIFKATGLLPVRPPVTL